MVGQVCDLSFSGLSDYYHGLLGRFSDAGRPNDGDRRRLTEFSL